MATTGKYGNYGKTLHHRDVARNVSDPGYYHTNHLGSTAFVTDGSCSVTQGFLYAPFGEIVSEYNAGFANGIIPQYAFNAKELDEETGMYYYEARYYQPPTFTSRDPHFERYFWHSPYAYCGNNPLNKVDPTGMDEWEIDGSGNIVNHTKTTEHDAFYMVGEDGKRIEGKSCEFNYGTIKSSNSKLSDKSGVTVDFYDVKGDENGTKLFEFFAENTKVEWGHMQIGKGGKSNGVNYLFTSHQVDKIRGVSSEGVFQNLCQALPYSQRELTPFENAKL